MWLTLENNTTFSNLFSASQTIETRLKSIGREEVQFVFMLFQLTRQKGPPHMSPLPLQWNPAHQVAIFPPCGERTWPRGTRYLSDSCCTVRSLERKRWTDVLGVHFYVYVVYILRSVDHNLFGMMYFNNIAKRLQKFLVIIYILLNYIYIYVLRLLSLCGCKRFWCNEEEMKFFFMQDS